jgi:hypothetical protein
MREARTTLRAPETPAQGQTAPMTATAAKPSYPQRRFWAQFARRLARRGRDFSLSGGEVILQPRRFRVFTTRSPHAR